MIQRDDLELMLHDFLDVSSFKDYAPNGLQVEGSETIHRIVTATTASLAAIHYTIDVGAEALLVHHGYFWKSEDSRIKGMKKQRISALLMNDINLLAYHLPLDAHPVVGNNAQLAKMLGINVCGQHPENSLIWYGTIDEQRMQSWPDILQRPLLWIRGDDRPIRRIAWCTGGAQSYFEKACDLDIDAYLTGEGSEFCYHMSLESGVHFIAAGHHATERQGIRALGKWLEAHKNLNVMHFDEPNPI
jgi:dinuclear metal center YbgI/SA1388 family protein